MAQGKIPSLSLPSGGGAMRGLGEKFSPDLFTGTGNFSVPIAVPDGRNGLTPNISLQYSSGNANGAFGLGWSLSIPGVSRSTAHGLPTYVGGEDTFIISGMEDLVPLPREKDTPDRFQPRTEGTFAQILHHEEGAVDYWEVQSTDGLKSFYGTELSAAPNDTWRDPTTVHDLDVLPSMPKIFTWNLSRTVDLFGNQIQYHYIRDRGVFGPHRWDVPLLEEIRYLDYDKIAAPKFLVTIKFAWEDRPDPFSAYRAGFEVRTTKRCKSITISVNSSPLKIYDFQYTQAHNGLSLLTRVQATGVDALNNKEALPPLTFTYAAFTPEGQTFRGLDVPDLPQGALLLPQFTLTDITGNGLPDVVELGGSLPRYWENRGDGGFLPPMPMRDAPAGLNLGDPGVTLMDTDGNGRQDLAVLSGPGAGVYPMRAMGGWDRRGFRRYKYAPSFNLLDSEVHLLDLDGDGAVDALRAGPATLECFFQDRKVGWRQVKSFPRRQLDGFPNVSFSDPRVRFASMTGDGLQGIVLIHQGRVEYWPSRGRGVWGQRVEMQNPPRLPDRFDPRRLLIGDVDGDGCDDIIYVGDQRITLWLNQSGERFSDPIDVLGTPPMTSEDGVRLVDILGVGTVGVLWISGPGSPSRRAGYFLDLTGRTKPYLLTGVNNHIGASIGVTYASSTEFAVRDAWVDRMPWQTPLPFPVQVVSKLQITDEVSHTLVTTEFLYHHGYWDGIEREFRGFGRVDRRDTETALSYRLGTYGDQVLPEYFSPPTETRTWFHQGAVGDEIDGWRENDYSSEYFSKDLNRLKRSSGESKRLAELPKPASRDALRALRGRVLRTELYALDNSSYSDRPYTVTESLHSVSFLPGQRPVLETLPEDLNLLSEDDWRLRVFFPFQVAERTSQWERGDEPMVRYQYSGRYDAFGHPQEQIAIAVPRSRALNHDIYVGDDKSPFLATLTRTTYAVAASSGPYIADRVSQSRLFEILNGGQITLGRLLEIIAAAGDALDTGTEPSGLKLLAETRTYYDGDKEFEGLPLGQLGAYGAAVRTEELAVDDDQLDLAFGMGQKPAFFTDVTSPPTGWPSDYWDFVKDSAARYPGHAGYRKGTGADAKRYYAQTSRLKYDFQESGGVETRGRITASLDPRDRRTTIVHETTYGLFPERIIDPAGLEVAATYDWHFLQIKQVKDPNGNLQTAEFSPLGLTRHVFVRGKKKNEGEDTKPSQTFVYDFSKVPISATEIQRQYHELDDDIPDPTLVDAVIEKVTYSDGFGRIVQSRAQAEQVIYGTLPLGGDVLDPDLTHSATNPLAPGKADHRVVVSGWKRYDNKGRVVESSESYFETGLAYQAAPVRGYGALTKTYYDPLGRVVKAVLPDRSQTRTIYGRAPILSGKPDVTNPDAFLPSPWEVYTYDPNDLDPTSAHVNTPSSIVLDALGRTIITIERLTSDGSDSPVQWLSTMVTYDVQGNPIKQIDPLGRRVIETSYDFTRKPLKTFFLDAGAKWHVRDAAGSQILSQDERGALILYDYDRAGRPARTWARDVADEKLGLRVVLKYGDDGVSDDATRNKRRDVNLLGQLMTQKDEAGLLSFVEYDFKGNVSKRERQVFATADLLKVFPPAPATPPPAGSDYWKITPFKVDWKMAMPLDTTTTYTTVSSFDAIGRIKWLIYPIPGASPPKLLPRYNGAGLLERLELDSGRVLIEQVGYNAKGQRVFAIAACTELDPKTGRPKKVLTRSAYDPQTFRLIRLRSEPCDVDANGQITPEGGALQDTGYAYDRAGNIRRIFERSLGSGTKSDKNKLDRDFTYDALYRLIRATGRETAWETTPMLPELLWNGGPWTQDLTIAEPYTETYEYDAVGFLRKLRRATGTSPGTAHTRTYAGKSGGPDGAYLHNRLESVTYPDDSGTVKISYEYDVAGNCTDEGSSRHMEWDAPGRLRVFRVQTDLDSEPTQYAQYLYDPTGARVKKIVRKPGGLYESIVYIDELAEHLVIKSMAGTDEGTVMHIMDGEQRMGRLRQGETFDMKPAELLILGDHLGSAQVELDWQKRVFVDREECRPFGETSFGSYARKRYRFTGKERDEESGLSYHGARYYACWLGRWLSPDPADSADASKLYQYASNRPQQNVDPGGMADEDIAEPPSTPNDVLTNLAGDPIPPGGNIATGVDPEFIPNLGAPEKQDPNLSPEQLGRKDLDEVYEKNKTLRDRVTAVSKELQIDPGLLAASLIAEESPSVWTQKSGKVASEVLGLDDWFDPNLARYIKGVIKAHPKLDFSYSEVEDTGEVWDTSTEKVGGEKKPRGQLDAMKAVAAAGVYLKAAEAMLERVIANEAKKQKKDLPALKSLTPVQYLSVLRVGFNSGVVQARDLYLKIVGGGDIPRVGGTQRDQAHSWRTAVLHVARAIHLDQQVFNRVPALYRP